MTGQVPNKYRASTGQDRQEGGETTTEVPRKYRGSPENEHGVNKYRTSTAQVPNKHRISIGEIEQLVLTIQGEMSSKKLMEVLELKHRPHFRNYYLIPALEQEFIEMTIPEKPKSSKQRYKLTEKGKALKKALENETD